MPSVFISYSYANRDFAERLAADLSGVGVRFFLDNHDLNVGDPLIEHISKAIATNDFFVVIISKEALLSEWVKKELSLALMKELSTKQVVVLPALIEDCEIPLSLKDKIYADFRHSYDDGLKRLLRALGVKRRAVQLRAPLEEKLSQANIQLDPRVLIVDPEVRWRAILKRIVEESGLSVVGISSFAEAGNLLRRQFFHLVVVELHLGNPLDLEDRSGLQILRIVHEMNEGTQCVMLSGYGRVEDGAMAVRQGAFAVEGKGNFSSVALQDLARAGVMQAQDALRQSEVGLEQMAKDHLPDAEVFWIDQLLRITHLGFAQTDKLIRRILYELHPLLPLVFTSSSHGPNRVTSGVQTVYYWSKRLSMPVKILIGESSLVEEEVHLERLLVLRAVSEGSLIGLVCPAFGLDFQLFQKDVS